MFPHFQPGSLPAARSSIYRGGGNGGGANGSSRVFGTAIGPGLLEKGLAAIRLDGARGPFMVFMSCTNIEGGDVTPDVFIASVESPRLEIEIVASRIGVKKGTLQVMAVK